ncbi:MAG: chorismate mutase, partial [Actinobacteria bacterium]|nr:chorismate mutase [Actinomycetota bacterium]
MIILYIRKKYLQMENKKEKLEGIEIKDDAKLIEEGYITIIAGPCAIESWEQLDAIAKVVKNLGLSFIRGGAYKPRTSP